MQAPPDGTPDMWNKPTASEQASPADLLAAKNLSPEQKLIETPEQAQRQTDTAKSPEQSAAAKDTTILATSANQTVAQNIQEATPKPVADSKENTPKVENAAENPSTKLD